MVARTWEDLPYAAELQRYGAFIALTRENLGDRVAAPPYPDEVAAYVAGAERAYVCGSVGFASYATRLLEDAGVAQRHDPGRAVRRDRLTPRIRPCSSWVSSSSACSSAPARSSSSVATAAASTGRWRSWPASSAPSSVACSISLLAGDGIELQASGIIGSLVGALIVTAGWRWYAGRSKTA